MQDSRPCCVEYEDILDFSGLGDAGPAQQELFGRLAHFGNVFKARYNLVLVHILMERAANRAYPRRHVVIAEDCGQR